MFRCFPEFFPVPPGALNDSKLDQDELQVYFHPLGHVSGSRDEKCPWRAHLLTSHRNEPIQEMEMAIPEGKDVECFLDM